MDQNKKEQGGGYLQGDQYNKLQLLFDNLLVRTINFHFFMQPIIHYKTVGHLKNETNKSRY